MDSRGKLQWPRHIIVSKHRADSHYARTKQVTYTKDSDTAHDGCVLGRGNGLVSRGEDTLGDAGATASRLDVDLFGRHFRLSWWVTIRNRF